LESTEPVESGFGYSIALKEGTDAKDTRLRLGRQRRKDTKTKTETAGTHQ
jgi:hypothetical protein